MLRISLLIVLALVANVTAPPVHSQDNSVTLYSVDISQATDRDVEAIRAAPGVRWWVELGDLLVVAGTELSHARMAGKFGTRRFELDRSERLYVGVRVHPNELNDPHVAGRVRLLASSG